MRYIFLSIALVGFAFVSPATAGTGQLGKAQLREEPIKALNDRVLLRMPAGAKLEPRGAESIMGAAPSTQEEARVVFDAGKERLIVMVKETFQTADKNMPDLIKKEADPDTIVEAIEDADKRIVGYALLYKKPIGQGETRYAGTSLLILPDQTVIVVSAFLDPQACEDADGAMALAKSILSQARGGKVPLDRSGGARRLPNAAKGKDLAIDLPRDVMLTCDEGIDFRVYRFQCVRAFGSDDTRMMLYMGGHPSLFSDRIKKEGDKPPAVTSGKGTFLGENVDWLSWNVKDRAFKETIASLGEYNKVHIHFSAVKVEDMKMLEKIAQGMKLVPHVEEKPATRQADPKSK